MPFPPLDSSNPYHVPIPEVLAPSIEEILAEKIWTLMADKSLVSTQGLRWRWKDLRPEVREKVLEVAREILGRDEKERVKNGEPIEQAEG